MKDIVLAILAGGTSRRYQKTEKWRDKALMEIDTIPLLVHFVRKGLEYYQKICISVNSLKRKETYFRILRKYKIYENIDIVIDKPDIKLKGVLRGIYSILKEYPKDYVQFISSDRPNLDLSILKKLDCAENEISILAYKSGLIEPLLALYGPKSVSSFPIDRLPLSRADVFIRLASHIRFYNLSSFIKQNNLDPNLFLNVNKPLEAQDLKNHTKDFSSLHFTQHRIVSRDNCQVLYSLDKQQINSDFQSFPSKTDHNYHSFLLLFSHYLKGTISKDQFRKYGIHRLEQEYEFWLENNTPFLALHALQDVHHYFPEDEKPDIKEKIGNLKEAMDIVSKKN